MFRPRRFGFAVLVALSRLAWCQDAFVDVPPSGQVTFDAAALTRLGAQWLSPVLRCDSVFLGGSVKWQAGPVEYVNLLQNGGFEEGKSGWQTWGGDFEPTTACAHSGAGSAKIVATKSWVCFYQQFDKLAVGQPHRAQAWGRAENWNGKDSFGLHGWRSKDGWKTWTNIPDAWANVDPKKGGEWQLLRWDFVPEAGWSYRITFELSGNMESGIFYVDDAVLANTGQVAVAMRSSQDGKQWSDWSKPTYMEDVRLACPQGKFLQLRADLKPSQDGKTPRLASVNVTLHRAIPFDMPWNDATTSPITDPGLPDAPAGKHGWISVRDGHFFWPDGQRAKFWGSQWLFAAQHPTREEADALAARYAKLGFNLWKWGGLQYTWLTGTHGLPEEKAERLDRLDYLFAQLKERGVYCYAQLDEYGMARICEASKELAEKYKIPAYKELHEWGQVYYFAQHPAVMAARDDYWRELWEHRNPYTGLKYKDEPAIVVCELVNENYLTLTWNAGRFGFDKGGMPEPYETIFTKRWNEFLQQRYASLDAVKKAWDDSTGDVLAQGESWGNFKRLPGRPGRPFNRFSAARTADLARFYAKIEDDYFQGARKFLGELGVKVPIIAGNWGTVALPTLEVASHYDVMDVHGYWDHPTPIGPVGTIRQNDPFDGKPEDPHHAGGLEGAFASCRVRGKPLAISEVNWSYPNDWQYLFLPRLVAYAAFQDWDMVIQHAYALKMPWSEQSLEQQLVNRNNPMLMTQNVLAARIFREGLIAPARKTITLLHTKEGIFKNYVRDLVMQSPVAFPLERGGEGLAAFLTPRAVLLHKLQHVFDAPEGTANVPLDGPSDFDGEWRSDTGELAMNFRGRLFTVNAPQVQGAAGALGGRTVRLGDVTLSLDTPAAAVFMVSLDRKPLAESRHMLLLAADKVANTGRIMEARGLKADPWGKAPVLAEIVAGKIEFPGRQGLVTVYALTPTGQRGESYFSTATGLVIGRDPSASSLWYEIEIEKDKR